MKYEVVSSTLEQTVPFDDGDMDKYALSLKDESGSIKENVAQWLKSGKTPFLEGATIDAEVVSQPRGGLKLKNAREVSANGAAPRSGGRGDPTGRSIEKQVALKVAGEIVAGVAAKLGKVPTAETVTRLAEGLDEFLLPKQSAVDNTPAPDDGEDIPF